MRGSLVLLATVFIACGVRAQDATQPPVGQHVVLTLLGRGVQVYSCKAAAESAPAQWAFVAPAARLFDKDGVEVGTHGDGPVWHLEDGSTAFGQVIAKTPSPDGASVPWLLLKAKPDGAGLLQSAELIRRSETKGGVAPSVSCEVGALLRVPYEATYTFYSSR